jgi:two-component system sensor histidine kinase DesK
MCGFLQRGMLAVTGTAAGQRADVKPQPTGAFAVGYLCAILVTRLFDVLGSGDAGQVPFTVALFALPVLYAVPGTRRVLARYRWQVLAVQAVLTWVPFAVFGGRWQEGIGGLLAGLVLLTVPGAVSWLLAGGLLTAEVLVRVTLTGLPAAPAWLGVVYVAGYYLGDALGLFGLVRLGQIVEEVQQARGQAAFLAVAGERLQAARSLQAAVGERIAGVAAKAAAARRSLPRDPAQARALVTAAGVTARDAVAQAREVTAVPGRARQDVAVPPTPGVIISARLAWAVLLGILVLDFAVENASYIVAFSGDGGRLAAVAISDIVLVVLLQLFHSWSARDGGRPRAWPLTLGLQAALVYAFLLPFVWAYIGGLGGFLAGSVLLLVPGRRRWAGYAAVVASWSVLYCWLPLRGSGITRSQRVPETFLYAAVAAAIGLLVYGLSRLAGAARQLEELRGELARTAVARERLRAARDIHDLLGLGLSAIALKSDLITRLIGRDNPRAATEIGEMERACAAAQAEIRRVTDGVQRLWLADELATAGQVLADAGIKVTTVTGEEPLPERADTALAAVLREAVTNILRHSAATHCKIEITDHQGMLRLQVSNDGTGGGPWTSTMTSPPAACGHAAMPSAGNGGSGLANLTVRLQAAGGRLTTRNASPTFDLIAEIPSAQLPAVPAPRLHRAPTRHASRQLVIRHSGGATCHAVRPLDQHAKTLNDIKVTANIPIRAGSRRRSAGVRIPAKEGCAVPVSVTLRLRSSHRGLRVVAVRDL